MARFNIYMTRADAMAIMNMFLRDRGYETVEDERQVPEVAPCSLDFCSVFLYIYCIQYVQIIGLCKLYVYVCLMPARRQ